MRIAENHPETMPFVVAVGKLIQNFGLIEWQTHEWIAVLQDDPMVGDLARHAKLRDRIETIRKMIARACFIEEEMKSQLGELWSLVVPHSELRNIVAHNAVVMGFANDNPSSEATVKGVLNFKPRDKSREAELVSVEEILGSVDMTAKIAAKLMAGLSYVRNARASAP